MPVFPTPARAAQAFRRLLQFSTARADPAIGPLAPASSPPSGWPQPGQALGEREAKRLLSAVGLPVAREVLCRDAEEAARTAERIGYPVVVKIDSPDIPHKTEAAALRLGLRDAAAVREAFAAIIDSVRAFRPEARVNGCLVQEQLENSVAEILLGVSPSPMGPMITVGLGGIFVEVFNDVSRRLAPVTPGEATAMLKELRGYKLLTGARGRPAADIDALAKLVAQLEQSRGAVAGAMGARPQSGPGHASRTGLPHRRCAAARAMSTDATCGSLTRRVTVLSLNRALPARDHERRTAGADVRGQRGQ